MDSSEVIFASLFQCWELFKSHFFTLLGASIVLNLLYTRYGSPLRKYPGPVLASLTRLYQVWIASTGRAEEHYLNLHHQYGPVVRIGPNEVSFASPNAAQTIFKTGTGFHKTEFYTVFFPNGLRDIFTEDREHVHAVKKRYAVPPYSLGSVQQHNQQIEILMAKFLAILDDFAAVGGRCDLGSWLHWLAFDVLGQFAFAQPFGFLDAGSDINNTIANLAQTLYESGMIGQMPFLEKYTRSNPIWHYLPKGENKFYLLFNMASKVLRKFQEAEKPLAEAKCLVESLLESTQKAPDKFNLTDVLTISMGAIAAGSDSTASTMHSFCWNVLSRPQVYQKLVDELLKAPSSDLVQYSEALTLNYFQACLKEAMRLQPAVGFNITRYVPDSGTEIMGKWLPRGTKVAVNAWVLHRQKEVFGDDAESFRPERWLESSPADIKRMERCLFQFGGGSHVCIGRHLALFEINKTLPTIFKRYHISLVHPEKPLDHRTGFFYIQSGLVVNLTKR